MSDYRSITYFSTKSSGSLNWNAEISIEYNNKTKKYSSYAEHYGYYNIDTSVKKITNTSSSQDFSIIVGTYEYHTLSNATVFSASVRANRELTEVGEEFEKGNSAKGTMKSDISLKFEKIADPPKGEEEMLFDKNKEWVLYGEDKIKTKSQVEKDTKDYGNNNGLKGYQIALIVIAVIIVIIIIVVVIILLLKKGKDSPKSKTDSGSGENA
ncbi:hypothetical protein TVAG_142480 [Trichomonas vaginalis G3]|uniref:Uncharacterized protein n=1 Tax=Trichomonas vaginalis (strain ATCC PRA-98 / G3) TaxID=412133 RepID=A2EHK7_TRIV3|nr:glycoprotein 38 family [Trichomonas vaginalis G3]EAY07894.1 hypothetical protein TVAG_142480 [Trichomonas vaginalis G3]KAI5514153.1 glycoprotein 38 family [Trichomonas vaginalis G3]|eukprot:XP_001320117.1 hypothetical protein [Trichomonas vaginalis G3]